MPVSAKPKTQAHAGSEGADTRKPTPTSSAWEEDRRECWVKSFVIPENTTSCSCIGRKVQVADRLYRQAVTQALEWSKYLSAASTHLIR